MSWTAERLDALPGGTVVAWEGAYYSWALHDTPGSLYGWLSDSGERWSSAEIVKSSEGSIRVVSVPIDALLSDETVWTSARHPQLLGKSVSIARDVLTRAIAHITHDQEETTP